ncbi:MAG: Na+/H+ antiporter subunit E [Candidatus Altiarchaeota archaeon]
MAYVILYLLNLAYNMLLSARDTGILAVTGKIDPVVVEVKTKLKKPISHVILANSITLTPGTVTIDVDHERQVLTVAALTPRTDDAIIPFEKYIRGMLE